MKTEEILNENSTCSINGSIIVTSYTTQWRKPLTKEQITNAVAQAWCHPKNEHKIMDSDLAMVIVDNILEAQKTEVKH